MLRHFPLIALLSLLACTTPTPPPAAAPAQEPEAAQPAQAGGPVAIGTVRVTASSLNVRSAPSTDASVIGKVGRGERLTLLAQGDSWSQVRLASGEDGWVLSEYVTRGDGATKKPASRCADRDYSFVKPPTPAFSESGAHGLVTVEANVDTGGNVTSTKVISNDTGDPALATLAERELKGAKFSPPMRDCRPRAFVFTYKRSF